MGEDVAVEAMKHGATDYLLKDRVARLGQAVQRALEQRRLRDERQQVETSLNLFRALLDRSNDGIEVIDPQTGRFLDINETTCQRLGYTRQELLSLTVPDINVGGATAASWAENVRQIRQSGFKIIESRHKRKDGSTFPVEINLSYVNLDRDYLIASVRDITERKQAEEKLRRSEADLAEGQQVSKLGSWRSDIAGKKVRWSDELYRIFDVEPTTFHRTYEDFLNCVLLEDRPRVLKMNADARVNGSSFEMEYRIQTRDGGLKSIREIGHATKDAGGKVVSLFGTAQDITERKRAEEALRESEEKFRKIFENVQDVFYQTDIEGRIIEISPSIERYSGYRRAELIGKPVEEVYHDTEDRGRLLNILREKGEVADYELRLKTKDGRLVHASVNAHILRNAGGQPAGVEGALRDITARKQAEESQARLATAVEQAAEAILITDPDGAIVYVNPAFEKISGYSRAEVLGQNPRILKSGKHEAVFYRRMWDVLKSGNVWQGNIINRSKNGNPYEEECIISPVRDPAGKLVNFVAVQRDVTREVQLQAQFRQSQKMEAFGQLAGGVAHDFNNILAVIQLQAGLLKSERDLTPEQHDYAGDIEKAAERGANLTRQLLLFSRKQVLQPRDLKLQDLVANIARMLQRTLGEQFQLQLKNPDEPLVIHADPGMIDQILLNLAVNARDAMPKGGQIIIETSAVEFDEITATQTPQARPGSFACLSVTDSGCGIPPEILPRIFEPFFTTKEVGKGTGLGLATVFGIVQQHKGWINVQSEVGRGSTFRVYLSRLNGIAQSTVIRSSPAPIRGGNETILLVEDEASLLASVQTTLSRLGYHVLGAATGTEALVLWQQHRDEIQLLLTDIVMPGGISGKELAEQLLRQNPGLRVIYASGYSAETADTDLMLEDGVNFLTKPFLALKLAQTVRRRLDQNWILNNLQLILAALLFYWVPLPDFNKIQRRLN